MNVPFVNSFRNRNTHVRLQQCADVFPPTWCGYKVTMVIGNVYGAHFAEWACFAIVSPCAGFPELASSSIDNTYYITSDFVQI